MSRKVKVFVHKIKPGRIEDAVGVLKSLQKKIKGADVTLAGCTAGGPETGKILMSFTYPDSKSMAAAVDDHPEEIREGHLRATAADSPFESIEISIWSEI